MAFDYAYGKTTLGELDLHGVHNEESGKFQLTSVTIEGQLVIPSRGFVKSLCKRFSISRNLQTKRTSGELLSLLVRSFPLSAVEYRVEWDESGTTWLFACEQTAIAEVLEEPAPADIPSPTSRLVEYGFAKSTDDTGSTADLSNKIGDDQDWPLLRDTEAQVPANYLPEGEQAKPDRDVFSTSPIGTPRPSVN